MSYVTCSLYQKTSSFNLFKVFQYKISYRISNFLDLYDNFEIFRKKISLDRIFENREIPRQTSTDFHFENGFELTKYRRINLVTSSGVAEKIFYYSPPPPTRPRDIV